MSIFSNIIQGVNTGIAVLGAARQQSGASGAAHPDVIGAIDNLVRQLNQLEVGFAALPATQRLQNANAALQAAAAIGASLEQIPVTRDTNTAYLSSAKAAVVAVTNHINQMIGEAQTGNTTTTTQPTTQPTQTNTQPVIDANGQVIYVPVTQQQQTNQLIDGIDNTTLLIGAVLLILLMK